MKGCEECTRQALFVLTKKHMYRLATPAEMLDFHEGGHKLRVL